MIRTGKDYRNALGAQREVFIDGERVECVAQHPSFAPLVDLRAKLYDMQHDEAHRDILTHTNNGKICPIASKLPYSQSDWWAKRRAADRIMNTVGGILTRTGEETVGEIWSLYDCRDALAEMDPQFAANIDRHIQTTLDHDLFQVTANTDPKGDRSRLPQEQDPDVVLRAVRETDVGIVVRGAKFVTAAAYADLAYTKPGITNWGDCATSDYALGFVCDLNAPGLKFICRSGFARPDNALDYPLTHRFDEIESLVVYDDVLVPWENVLFYRHTRAATLIRATLHRYSAFAFIQRIMKFGDMMIGAALLNARQTGIDRYQAVQEKLARLAVWREGINAHLTAAIALGERSPAGLMMPNQSLLYAGRVLACSQLHDMMHLTRELCGAQLCLTPNAATFNAPETAPWLKKCYSPNEDCTAEDRRKLMAFARDLVSSDHAGHRLAHQLFGQSPPFAHLASVYHQFDWEGPIALVKDAANLTDRVPGDQAKPFGDNAIGQWFSSRLPPGRSLAEVE